MQITYDWRGDFDDDTLNALHSQGFGHSALSIGWWEQVQRHSLGWVVAKAGGRLVGFVNVAWDGGVHAFVLDTLVDKEFQRRGVGTSLVAEAARGARAAGCEWLHVDFDEEHRSFYFEACGFQPTDAGLIAL
ncbi:GNAT family N-acetyltransferase [Streptomyces uncialis]|uniref:GNAT family N-acetyltransferase n=1 Tax=Streptomyces uncialis TaxID=1048205 RepID=UPI0037B5AE49